MGFTVSPELAMTVSAASHAAYAGTLVAARKPFLDFTLTPGSTGTRGTMTDWATLLVSANAAKDFVISKEGPKKKHLLAAGTVWAGCAALSVYHTFGPKKAMTKKGLYVSASIHAVNGGLCFLAAKDM